jgi:DNA-binding beta-propeller fold protein YncE
MRNLAAALSAVAMLLIGYKAGATTMPARYPSVLIVPYLAVAGGALRSDSVSVYKIDATTGALTLAPGSPFAAGTNPGANALAPGGRFAYVANKGSNNISAYRLNATTGALTPVAGSPFAMDYSPNGPDAITIDSTGKYAYVASGAGVSAFSIDATTGALARVPGEPFATDKSDGFGTASIAVDPSGRFAYALNFFRNTIATYTIDATGGLTLAGSPLDAGQNNNDPGSFKSVTIDPKGRFAYVTSPCCVLVYAIDATTGALGAPAHLGVSPPGDAGPNGFAIDPTGRFAYVVVGSRVNAYTLDTATGRLKAVAGRNFAVHAGTYPYSVTIDPAGTFAYVLNPGSSASAATIAAYRIDASTGALTALARSPFAVAANTTDPIARWFDTGRCAAFDEAVQTGAQAPPLAKRDSEGLIFDPATASTRGYAYDPKNHLAFRYPNTDSGATLTLRVSGPPPAGVQQRDLSRLHTASGITLGTRAETVVRLLGKPKIVSGCGQQRYVYLRSLEGEPTSLEFTIAGGKVTEIFEDFGG